MTKTKKILATVAALGAMTVGGFALAAPADGPRRGSDVPPCVERSFSASDWAAARYESLGEMLTLTDAQKPLWKAYVDARMARFAEAPRDVKPAVDVQDRLERRAERLAARADRVKKIADTRAELLKSLSVEQKYVLESYEYRPRGFAKDGPDFRRDRDDRPLPPHLRDRDDRPLPPHLRDRDDRPLPPHHRMMPHHPYGPGFDCPWR